MTQDYDPARDFEAIYKEFYDPLRIEERKLIKNREEREKNNKEDNGL